jgi:hypothetical protein
MPFEKGTSGNPGGRKRGSRNKSPEQIRSLFQTFINRNIQGLQADYDCMEPRDRLAFIEKLTKYVLPRPLNELERLTDEQLDELLNRLKQGSNDTN